MKTVILLKRYIKDLVYGANDGIVTTFAIVASIEGAELGTAAILIVGFASLFADGFSMASSNFLSNKAENARKANNGIASNTEKENPKIAALFTFIAFVLIGLIPLIPYFFKTDNYNTFLLSCIATAIALFGSGALRTKATGGSALRAGTEMLLIGGSAASVAYFIGNFLEQWK
ncbi:VIT1/CCC1 transporter family protein [Marivirga sp. S37H4]|uniref:VIT1/CCC1 transporter family protein n=1 Tax=Marivirga aurantiaca TaxID=2802615 RepID=A0A934WYY7_9BACT|nr:VIT1/CCC1 transporter family protein [Marivirga aurantiaca]MBK6265579.1 VIT1/CCC1 transporter family protein [Marivirga aurantiaca]